MEAVGTPFPERTKQLMAERGMTRQELAGIAGVTEVTLNRWLGGTAVPKGPAIVTIARALNTTGEYLFGLEDIYYNKEHLSFGQALEQCVKHRKRIARTGWNGKNMCVAYQPGYPQGIPCNKNTAETWGIPEGSLFKCRPYLQLKCADGTFQMWTASQSDILADDWMVVE